MKRAIRSQRKWRIGWRALGILLALGLLIIGTLSVLPLRADDSSKTPSLQAGSNTPTRGESGWINLPHLRGLIRIDRRMGKSLFEDIKALNIKMGYKVPDLTASGAFVVEGADADLSPAAVIAGVPEVSIAALGEIGWQAVFTKPFQARFEPELVRPDENRVGLVFPKRFIGAVLRMSSEVLPEEQDLYFIVESEQILLSWQAIVNLAGTGVTRVVMEAVSLDGDHLLMGLGSLIGDSALEIAFGSSDF